MPSRLSATQKKQLLEGYLQGKSSLSLAKAFGCSPNTVSRTVKALLPLEEYNALKSSRSKAKAAQVKNGSLKSSKVAFNGLDEFKEVEKELQPESNASQFNFGTEVNNASDLEKDLGLEDSQGLDDLDSNPQSNLEDFHEVVPLLGDFEITDRQNIQCKPFSKDLLPTIVYLVVDRSVELDSRALSEFPELDSLDDEEKKRTAICLFENQRSAKRNCGRNQRVIKIPDTNLLNICRPFLISKGITRLILEGMLISLDDN